MSLNIIQFYHFCRVFIDTKNMRNFNYFCIPKDVAQFTRQNNHRKIMRDCRDVCNLGINRVNKGIIQVRPIRLIKNYHLEDSLKRPNNVVYVIELSY